MPKGKGGKVPKGALRGLLETPKMLDSDDGDLEAELLALTGNATKAMHHEQHVLLLSDIDKMVACDDNEDENMSGDDENELLAELKLLQDDATVDGNEQTSSLESPVTNCENVGKVATDAENISNCEGPSTIGGATSRHKDWYPKENTALRKATVNHAIIKDRLLLYQNGLDQAKHHGDMSKVRRYKRAIIVIEELLQSANAGQQINEDALPPIIIIKNIDSNNPEGFVDSSSAISVSDSKGNTSCKVHSLPVPEVAKPLNLDTPEYSEFDLTDADLDILASSFVDDRNQDASLQLPHTASQSLPTKLLPVSTTVTKEQVRMVLVERRDQYKKAMHLSKKSGNVADQKQYGIYAVQFERVIKSFDQGMPVDLKDTPPPPPGFKSLFNYDISQYQSSQMMSHASPKLHEESPKLHEETESDHDPSIPTPATTLEALQQRLDKYKEGIKHSTEKGETSRIRRLNRIVKQYEDAIKCTIAGNCIDYSELPSPPGFPPIPIDKKNESQSQPIAAASRSLPVGVLQANVKPSLSDLQLQNLQHRAKEYRQAARDAKSKGDNDNALLYLRYFKAIEPMVKAALAGLPVDLTQLPPSPFSDQTDIQPSKSLLAHLGPASSGDTQTFELIEKHMNEQIKFCQANASTYEGLGNVGAASQYKNLANQCQRDLLAIKGIKLQGLAPPKFTMEIRKFAMVHSNPHLSDKQVEVEVVRGITVPAPSGYTEGDLNLYVEIEFPWPSGNPQSVCTDCTKGTSSPRFLFKHLFDIDRKQSRSLQRVFKRQQLKCRFYQHRTLRKDLFVGQAAIPLDPLEKKSSIFASEDLKDERGRKSVGGKIEIYVRLREPLNGQDEESTEQNWLVFQEAIATEATIDIRQSQQAHTTPVSPVAIDNTTSLEALKLELTLVHNAIKCGKNDAAVIQRKQAIQQRMHKIKQQLEIPSYTRQYVSTIMQEIKSEKLLELQLIQRGCTREAKIVQGRRRVMENELSKLPRK